MTNKRKPLPRSAHAANALVLKIQVLGMCHAKGWGGVDYNLHGEVTVRVATAALARRMTDFFMAEGAEVYSSAPLSDGTWKIMAVAGLLDS